MEFQLHAKYSDASETHFTLLVDGLRRRDLTLRTPTARVFARALAIGIPLAGEQGASFQLVGEISQDGLEKMDLVKETWRREGERATFFGKPVSEMTRDELLEVIGWCLGGPSARVQG